MVTGGDPRPGSVVSVADLIARDAPWSGAPRAVDVTGGQAPGIPAQRASSRPDGARASARTPAADPGPLRRLAALAWSPNWRFVTICAAVLVAGLLSNVMLLTATSTPIGGARAAGSEEGGYPADGVKEPPRLTVEPQSPTLPGLGLPLALASLGQAIPASTARTTPAAAALVGTPTGTVGPVLTGGGSASGTSTQGRPVSNRTGGTGLGDTVSGVGGTLGNTVGDVGRALPQPLKSPVEEVGRTTKKLTDTVGDTVDGVTGSLLGSHESSGSRHTRESADDSDARADRSERSSESRQGGGVLGGLLGGGG